MDPNIFYNNQLDKLCELIHTHGDFVNSIEINGYTPLRIAIDRGYVEMVDILLAIGADPNRWNGMLQPPLISAINNGMTEIVKLLIQCPRTDLNIGASRDYTPLRCAILNGNIEMVILLLDAGADPSSDISSGGLVCRTPFDIIKRDGRTEMIKTLQNYFPSLQTLSGRCIRDNQVDVSQLPKMTFV